MRSKCIVLKTVLGIAFLFAAGCQTPMSGEAWAVRPASLVVDAGERQLLVHRSDDVPYKPYVQVLRSPVGVNILRDAPADHLHHHGLMYAVTVDGVDYWAETEQAGQQVVRRTRAAAPTKIAGWWRSGFIQSICWVPPRDENISLIEERTITAWQGDDLDASLISWNTQLAVPECRPTRELSGERYFGLGMRFVESIDRGGTFYNADGATGVAGTNNVRSPWCAYTAAADGHTVTVAMFDHPANLRHPSYWFTMDDAFAYMSNTPGVHHEKITIKRGTPLSYRFGVAVWDGEVASDRVQALYERWVKIEGGK